MNSSHPINPLSSINYKCGCLRLMNLVQVVVIVVLLITFLHIFWISFSNYLCFFLFKRLVALRNNISFNWSDDWTCIYTLFHLSKTIGSKVQFLVEREKKREREMKTTSWTEVSFERRLAAEATYLASTKKLQFSLFCFFLFTGEQE
jgi:hypothetical protein